MNPPPEIQHPTPAEEVMEPISADLTSLLEAANQQAMSLAQIESHLKERGYALLVLFLAAPFPLPTIPGLSVPFGIAICLIGVAFMIRRRPRLPQVVLRTKLEYATLQKVMTSLIGFGIVSGGLFLALPLPIPLTNAPPALSIIFLVVGMLCRDGVMVIIGYLLGIASWAYLLLWIYFGAYLWEMIRRWF
jgi:hypothetical protein